MIMKAGQHWHCTNPACHCEIQVQSSSEVPGSDPPRCVCGAFMKRLYAQPKFTYLEFLQVEEQGVPLREGSREA